MDKTDGSGLRLEPRRPVRFIARACLLGLLLLPISAVQAQDQAASGAKGGIRGVVYDADYNVPVLQAKVSVPEANRTTVTGEDGHYAIADLPPGIYTVVFAREGFVRETRLNVLVLPGTFAEVETRLFGEYTDMEELVVSDIDLGGGTEIQLLAIRQQSSGIMDSVGSDLIKRANQSTAAGALRLVAGASVEGGKYAVVRGLGDRYTSTQINAVRLPSADPDKRAVQLDQFPSAMIESIQVSKTFLPDQQGDSGAGTINIVTRSVPEESILSFKVGTAYKPTITGNSDFRWNPRGMDYFGESDRDLLLRSFAVAKVPSFAGNPPDPGLLATMELSGELAKSLDPRVGTTTEAPPPDTSWGVTVGDVVPLGEEWRVGGLGSFSYSCKYEGHNGGLLQNASVQEGTLQVADNCPQTESVGVEKILWGGVATVGLRKGDEQDIGITFIGNHAADSYAQEYVYNPQGANDVTEYKEILDYLERDFYTVQEHGRNTLPGFENWNAIPGVLSLQAPVLEWTVAQSDSLFYEPDRTTTIADRDNGNSHWSNPSCVRTWTTIDEQSRQYFLSIKEPFENWTDDKGYVKVGYFHDDVNRTFLTDYLGYAFPSSSSFNTNGLFFSRFGPPSSSGPLPIWDTLYSSGLGDLGGGRFGTHAIQTSLFSSQPPIDYTGEQQIRAWYAMGDLPVFSWLRMLGGVRTESTYMQTDVRVNAPPGDPLHNIATFHEDYTTYPGARTFVFTPELDSDAGTTLNHTDVLPALGVVVKPFPEMQLRLNWSQTMARPTFKELTPVATPIQGTSDFFIGNPNLQMSSMNNYDARLEIFPSAGNLVAISAFLKRIKDPIDRVLLENVGLTAYVPINYPEASLKGLEAEFRQALGAWWQALDGLSVGANGTLLQSDLTYDQYSVAQFQPFSGNRSRPMTGQPDYLANLNCTYDITAWGASLNLFYTFQGTTLAAGEATVPSDTGPSYIPNVYQKPSGTLSASVSKTLDTNWTLTLGAKNLLRPAMTQYYDDNGTKLFRTRYTTPIEYTFGLEGKW